MTRVIKFAVLGTALLVCGSSLAAEALTWAGCGITKKSFMAELSNAYQAKYGTEIVLEGGGATKGIRRVGDKSVNIGGSCRPKLPGNSEELSTQLNPVAWDALVVIVHPDNPVNNITLDQVRRVYEGKVANWKELGGKDQPLELQIRKGKTSGVGRTLRELAFGDFDKDFVAKAVHKSSGPLEQAVEANANAIGITGVSSARKRKVKILQLQGKEPNYDNIRSGEYLFYRPLYIAHNPADPRYSEVKKFIDFAHSREGRDIIRKQGVVPYLDALHLIRKQREQWQHSHEMMRVGQN